MNRTISTLTHIVSLLILFIFTLLILKTVLSHDTHLIESTETERVSQNSDRKESRKTESNEISNINLHKFSRLLPVEYKKTVSTEKKYTPEEKKDAVRRTDYISFIGTMTDSSGKEFYYFKDERSGRIIKLLLNVTHKDWKLTEIYQDHFILSIKDNHYEISR